MKWKREEGKRDEREIGRGRYVEVGAGVGLDR